MVVEWQLRSGPYLMAELGWIAPTLYGPGSGVGWDEIWITMRNNPPPGPGVIMLVVGPCGAFELTAPVKAGPGAASPGGKGT